VNKPWDFDHLSLAQGDNVGIANKSAPRGVLFDVGIKEVENPFIAALLVNS
jgi:hypothetical protein